MKNIFKRILITIVVLNFAISCQEGCLDPNALNYNSSARKSNDELCEYDTNNKEFLFLETHHKFDNVDFNLDSIYFDDFGTMIKFNRAAFYVSKNCFYNSNNLCFDDTVNYLLVDPSITNYNIGYLEKDIENISIEFQVGVDSISNHIDPAIYNSNHPLSYQSPSMHWQMGNSSQDWSYLFIVTEGMADLNSNGIFESGEIFVFHIGGDPFRCNNHIVNCDVHQINDELKVKVKVNWADVIDDLDIKNSNFTHTMDNIPLAQKISDNCGNLISEHL